MATIKKTTIKKAKDDMQAQPKPKPAVTKGPKYVNLQMGKDNESSEGLGYVKAGKQPNKQDSITYAQGYNYGYGGGKEYSGERNMSKMGRWEGQNAAKADRDAKAAVPKKKNGGALKAVPADKKGLKGLPTAVRNKMGFQKNGGAMKAKSGVKMKTCKYGC
jgi:hypothetical protein